jgi:sigma-B regulation protein RsbU (phosphoserine phosphatase)
MKPFNPGSQKVVPANLAALQIEMDIARRVQLNLLPPSPPSISGLDLSALFQPALHVGGDFYDFIAGPNQLLTIFIGDVSGKGTSAAMLMTLTLAVLRAEAYSPQARGPAAILQTANAKLLAEFTRVEMFVTVFVGQYDSTRREMVFASAGHSPVIFRPASGEPRLLEPDGIALGISETGLIKEHRLCLGKGDLLIAMTDGLTEARNSRSECFGVDRLLRQVQSFDDQSAFEVSTNLLKIVRQFSGFEPQADDQTVLVLRCT